VLYVPELDGQDLSGKFVAMCKMESDGVPESLDEEILYEIYDEYSLEVLELTEPTTLRKFISKVYPRFIHYLNEVEREIR
jgi:hypothetical protein